MNTWIALFRGINVGGRNPLPMAELRAALTSQGLREVRTYIQSGNVVFRCNGGDSSSIAKDIEDGVEEHHGFRPTVLVLADRELVKASEQAPFRKGTPSKELHYFFLRERPADPDLEGIRRLQSSTEHWELIDRVFYLNAPDGIGRSKLAARVEKLLGVATTARNARTVEKLLSLAAECAHRS